MQLPVNPEKVSVQSSRGYNDIEVAQLGEFTVMGNAKLRGFSFSSFFPKDYGPYCEYRDVPDPWNTVAMIEGWMDTRRPIRLTVTGTPINFPVTIREFTYEEKAGAPGDVYYSLDLREYRFIQFRSVSEVIGGGDGLVQALSADDRPSSWVVPGEYVVKSGDSLWGIAQTVYKRGDLWRTIYNANKNTIGANPNLIRPGQKLVIPNANE